MQHPSDLGYTLTGWQISEPEQKPEQATGDFNFLIYLFFPDKSKDGYTFMWNQWGVNWIMLSIMKILAVSSGSADFLKLGFATDVATVAMMIKGWIPEFKPFMLFFGLEMLAFGKLAFA